MKRKTGRLHGLRRRRGSNTPTDRHNAQGISPLHPDYTPTPTDDTPVRPESGLDLVKSSSCRRGRT